MSTTIRSGIVHALSYRRISGSERQKHGISLETQQNTLRTYVARQTGWVLDGEYTDVMTGRKAGRPQYQAMLEHARRLARDKQRVAIVVVWLDRLGRNKAEYFRAEEELDRLGAETHAVEDGGRLDPTHAGIKAVLAADEAKKIGARVGKNRATIVRNGWFYGRVPFGYVARPPTEAEIVQGCRKSMSQIEPDPLTRDVGVEVFTRVAGGESVRSVAKWLSGLPELRRGGRSWPWQCVIRLLRSPSYISRPASADIDDVLARPRGHWQSLIADDLWAQVQTRIASHDTRPHQATGRFLLTGFIRCAECGARMSAIRNHRSFSYRCQGHQLGAAAPLPGCIRTISLPGAERAVLAQVGALLASVADPADWPLLKAVWEQQRKPTDGSSQRVAELERTIAQARRRLADAATLLVDGTLDRMGYEALRDRELATLVSAEQDEARQAVVTTPAPPALDQALAQAPGWAHLLAVGDVADRRGVLDRLVELVSVRRVAGSLRFQAVVSWTPLGRCLAASAHSSPAGGTAPPSAQ